MISTSKNVHIDKLDDMMNKYNNTYHSTIKMESVDLKSNSYINFSKGINDELILNLKLMIILEYQNIEIFFQKAKF